MSQFFLKPSQNRHTEDFRAFFGVKPVPSGCKMITFYSYRIYGLLARLFGSDGWNRTTDLGVMNPTL